MPHYLMISNDLFSLPFKTKITTDMNKPRILSKPCITMAHVYKIQIIFKNSQLRHVINVLNSSSESTTKATSESSKVKSLNPTNNTTFSHDSISQFIPILFITISCPSCLIVPFTR